MVVCVAGAAWLALNYFIPAPPSKITIATGQKNQTYDAIGNKYREILARSGIKVEVRQTNGGIENIQLLNDRKSGIDVAFSQGGVDNAAQSPDLLSLGRINYQTYWIFHRAAVVLDDLRQIKGKRVAVGPAGSGQRVMADKVLGAAGVNSSNTTLIPFSTQAAYKAMKAGEIDVLFLSIAIDAPVLRTLLEDPEIKPMSFTEADALSRIFPFVVPLQLPRAVIDFEKSIPAAPLTLIAASNVVLVRSDIHPVIIDLLAQAMVQTHGSPGVFQRAGEFPTQTDPEYPVSLSAREYYRNGPTFLNRYLPFWMTHYMQRVAAVLVATIAIVIPVFSFGPKAFKWLVATRLSATYRRLRAIEARLQSDLTMAELSSLDTDLQAVDREILSLKVPTQHSDLHFATRAHLSLVRESIDLRRAALLGRPQNFPPSHSIASLTRATSRVG